MDHEQDLELLKQNFPYVRCYCELCDCGRHRHHKDCVKSRKQRTPTKYQPKTDYQATFKPHKVPKPRSSKRPAPSRRMIPPPLDDRTVQREQYKPIDVDKHGRPPAYHRGEKFEAPKVPFDHDTVHHTVYVPQPLENVELVAAKGNTFSIGYNPQFHGTTTNDDYYKNWGLNYNQLSFTEPPSFMGSMLFPSNKQEEIKSVMRQSYPGVTAKKTEPAKIPPSTIKIGDGVSDHLTVHRDVYRGDPGQKSQIIIHAPELGRHRASFHGETQNNRDFKFYGANAGRRHPALPAPDTIDLKFNNRRVFDTEQRKVYRGHDTRVHAAPPAARTDNHEYRKPEVCFETKTSHKVDYIPQDLAEAAQERARMPDSKMTTGGKFHSETAYKHYYKNWDSPRGPQRFGDFLDGINNMYLPPVQRFDATTTNQDQFTVKTTELRENMKPKPVPIAKQGSHNFDTVNRLTYKGEKPPMCKAEAFLLQQELKRRLAAEGLEGSSLAKSIKPAKDKTVNPVFIC